MSKAELVYVSQARTYLDTNSSRAAFVVRSVELAKKLGIGDLLWELSKDGTAHRNDVEPLLDQLEEACK